jgi:trk system potassium uptake protein TrkH
MMPQVAGSVSRYPARASLAWFLGMIVVGSVLLSLPFSSAHSNRPISPLDAAFTATSAACVTGLAVRSTPHDFSAWGQLVILVLFQIGGVGIMTLTTFVVFQLGARGTMRHRKVLESTLGTSDGTDLRTILWSVLGLTAVCELTGFALLFVHRLWTQTSDVAEAAWWALFHAVSAFCNAGFALHDDSLSGYASDWFVCGVVMSLVMIGGIGYPVLLDLLRRRGAENWSRYCERLQLHTKLTIIASCVLWVVPAMLFLVIEWDGVFAHLPPASRPLAAMFQSVTSRTAGFNTVEIGQLSSAALFITILLMFVGAGACSTAGGFKVSTASVLVLRAWNTFRGRTRINVFRRTIAPQAVERATATAMLFISVAVAALVALLLVEELSSQQSADTLFRNVLFEVASALGTVGLSTGITPTLTDLGKAIIIGLMFMGRLGPISVFAALSRANQNEPLEYSSEEPLVG